MAEKYFASHYISKCYAIKQLFDTSYLKQYGRMITLSFSAGKKRMDTAYLNTSGMTFPTHPLGI